MEIESSELCSTRVFLQLLSDFFPDGALELCCFVFCPFREVEEAVLTLSVSLSATILVAARSPSAGWLRHDVRHACCQCQL
jgi:hypothetical protein